MPLAESTARPRRLRCGATVALIAPAGPVAPERLTSAVRLLESWGLRVERFPSAHAVDEAHGYLAGADTVRAKDFERAWADPAITAVIAARGGYGCQRILPLIDWDVLRAAEPKVFAGSSDTTALHQAIDSQLGLPTLFAPMPAGARFDDEAAAHLRDTLLRPHEALVLGGQDAACLVQGRAAGVTVGGNLSLLAAGIGSPEPRQPRDAIALLEDVGEAPYRLDRMLTQLLRSGWFDGVTGIALGSWSECGPIEQVRAVLLDRLGPLEVPIVWNLGFGHHEGSLTVPLGVRAQLDADSATLTLAEPALA